MIIAGARRFNALYSNRTKIVTKLLEGYYVFVLALEDDRPNPWSPRFHLGRVLEIQKDEAVKNDDRMIKLQWLTSRSEFGKYQLMEKNSSKFAAIDQKYMSEIFFFIPELKQVHIILLSNI